jgi:hypothetical protein
LPGHALGKPLKIVNVQVPPQDELNRPIFPSKMPSTKTPHPHMKHPKLTLQLQGFLFKALFLQKGSQKRAHEQLLKI